MRSSVQLPKRNKPANPPPLSPPRSSDDDSDGPGRPAAPAAAAGSGARMKELLASYYGMQQQQQRSGEDMSSDVESTYFDAKRYVAGLLRSDKIETLLRKDDEMVSEGECEEVGGRGSEGREGKRGKEALRIPPPLPWSPLSFDWWNTPPHFRDGAPAREGGGLRAKEGTRYLVFRGRGNRCFNWYGGGDAGYRHRPLLMN